ncbi:MAG: hypothetical protein ACRD1A_13295, partial [Terriglobales bacterium]
GGSLTRAPAAGGCHAAVRVTTATVILPQRKATRAGLGSPGPGPALHSPPSAGAVSIAQCLQDCGGFLQPLQTLAGAQAQLRRDEGRVHTDGRGVEPVQNLVHRARLHNARSLAWPAAGPRAIVGYA